MLYPVLLECGSGLPACFLDGSILPATAVKEQGTWSLKNLTELEDEILPLHSPLVRLIITNYELSRNVWWGKIWLRAFCIQPQAFVCLWMAANHLTAVIELLKWNRSVAEVWVYIEKRLSRKEGFVEDATLMHGDVCEDNGLSSWLLPTEKMKTPPVNGQPRQHKLRSNGEW